MLPHELYSRPESDELHMSNIYVLCNKYSQVLDYRAQQQQKFLLILIHSARYVQL